MSPVSKAQQKAVIKYMKNNYDEIKVRVPKGKKEIIKEFADSKGESVNGFINTAIDEKMEKKSSMKVRDIIGVCGGNSKISIENFNNEFEHSLLTGVVDDLSTTEYDDFEVQHMTVANDEDILRIFINA